MSKELRYSESPSTEVSRTIPASPEVLWALLSDINLPARFSTEFKGAEWLDGASAPHLPSSSRRSTSNGKLKVAGARRHRGVFALRQRPTAPLSPNTARSAQAEVVSTLLSKTGLTRSTRSSLTGLRNTRKTWNETLRALPA
ncbi:MAG: SRPBCC family protein [Ilumatobacteraceae bacterium]